MGRDADLSKKDGQANKYVWPRLGYSSLTLIGLVASQWSRPLNALILVLRKHQRCGKGLKNDEALRYLL